MTNSTVTVEWNPFPMRRIIARGAFVLLAIALIVSGDLNSALNLLFASFVVDLFEGYLDIFEQNRTSKTGIFDSKLKYILFWDGGTIAVWLATLAVFPNGMKSVPGVGLWVLVFLLTCISTKARTEAAIKRTFQVTRTN